MHDSVLVMIMMVTITIPTDKYTHKAVIRTLNDVLHITHTDILRLMNDHGDDEDD